MRLSVLVYLSSLNVPKCFICFVFSYLVLPFERVKTKLVYFVCVTKLEAAGGGGTAKFILSDIHEPLL